MTTADSINLRPSRAGGLGKLAGVSTVSRFARVCIYVCVCVCLRLTNIALRAKIYAY